MQQKSFLRLFSYPFERPFLPVLIMINFLGSIYGYYWYRYQLAETSWNNLIFVPDSPLSSSLFTLVLITLLIGRRNTCLELLACFWVIKYGIWAVIINVDSGYTYQQFDFVNWMLSLSHAGMALEGFLFLRLVNFSRLHLLVVALWMVINDYMDYAMSLHPWLFDTGQLRLARASAISLTVFLVLLGWLLNKKKTHY